MGRKSKRLKEWVRRVQTGPNREAGRRGGYAKLVRSVAGHEALYCQCGRISDKVFFGSAYDKGIGCDWNSTFYSPAPENSDAKLGKGGGA